MRSFSIHLGLGNVRVFISIWRISAGMLVSRRLLVRMIFKWVFLLFTNFIKYLEPILKIRLGFRARPGTVKKRSPAESGMSNAFLTVSQHCHGHLDCFWIGSNSFYLFSYVNPPLCVNICKIPKAIFGFDTRFNINRFDFHMENGKFYNVRTIGIDVDISMSFELSRKK